MFQVCFKGVPRKILGRFKEVSRVFSHGSHRSYPSRRRACFFSNEGSSWTLVKKRKRRRDRKFLEKHKINEVAATSDT